MTGRSVEFVETADFDWDVVTREFEGKGVLNTVITLGSKGAVCRARGMSKAVFVPAEKVKKVVDTTAAGDTFVGAYAVAVVRGEGVVREEDVRGACRAAGRTVERRGAQEAIPWGDEV